VRRVPHRLPVPLRSELFHRAARGPAMQFLHGQAARVPAPRLLPQCRGGAEQPGRAFVSSLGGGPKSKAPKDEPGARGVT